MSFGGHVIDMVNRMNQNRAQRPSNRSKFKENNREVCHSENEKNKSHPVYKTVSKTTLTEIKKQIKERTNAEEKRAQMYYGILIIVGILLISLMLYWLQ